MLRYPAILIRPARACQRREASAYASAS